MSKRIIGCGTACRGDDPAGLLVVWRLRQLGVEAYEQSRDGLDLIENWQGQVTVVLIDAVVTGGSPGAVTVWNGKHAPVSAISFRSSTHAFGVAEAIRLARVLDRMPQRLLIYGIEGRRFDLGRAPSPEVIASSERLAHCLARAGERLPTLRSTGRQHAVNGHR
jgi:hydrogenase maturation protease